MSLHDGDVLLKNVKLLDKLAVFIHIGSTAKHCHGLLLAISIDNLNRYDVWR